MSTHQHTSAQAFENQDKSKKIVKADDDGKQFLIDTLNGHTTRGFDVDSIYVEKTDTGGYRWTIIELLKAESVPPEVSHPKYYWSKNCSKFLSLWALAQALIAGGFEVSVILVNYRDSLSKVKVIKAKSMSKEGLETISETVMSFEEWQKFYIDFNDNKKGATWDVLNYLGTRK